MQDEATGDRTSPTSSALPWYHRLDWLLIGTWGAGLAFSAAVWWLLAYIAISAWRA